MPKMSAGLLMYRRRPQGLEVLLGHPGGPFYRRKDEGVWSIPKGQIESGEDGLAAARREFREETGFETNGPFHALSPVRLGSGKIVHAWAVEGDCDPRSLRGITFEMEWPPRSGVTQHFPEIDRVQFFPLEIARRKLHPNQAAFVEELERVWRTGTWPDGAPFDLSPARAHVE